MDKLRLRLHSSIPEEMMDRFYKAGLLALLHSLVPFPCIHTVDIEPSSALQLRGQRRILTELPF